MARASSRRRAALWQLGGGAFQAATAFGANLWLMHLLAPELFGRFAMAGATIALVVGAASLRPATLAIRARAQDEARVAERFGRWTSLECATLGGLLALVLLATGPHPAWIWVLLAVELALHLVSTAKALVERRQPYAELSLVEGGSAFASHATAVALAATGFGIGALVARQAVLAAVQVTWLLARRAPLFWLPARPSPALVRARLREARDVWADGLLEALFARLLVLAAGGLGGARGAGYFSQAWRLAQVPHQLLQPLAGRLALNWASRTDSRAHRSDDRRRLLSILLPPLALAALLAVLFADPVVPWLFGERWRPVAPLLVASLGAILATSPFAVLKMHLLAERHERALLLSRVVQLSGLGLGWLSGLLFPVSPLGALAVGAGAGLVLSCPLAAYALAAGQPPSEPSALRSTREAA